MAAPSGGLTPDERESIALTIADVFTPYGQEFDPDSGARLLEARMVTLLRNRERNALLRAAESLERDAHNQREQTASRAGAPGAGIKYETHGSRTADRLAKHLRWRADNA